MRHGLRDSKEIWSVSIATLKEIAFQNVFNEIAIRVSVEIFVASFSVVCLVWFVLVSVAHGRTLANSPQARANMAMCVVPLNEPFHGQLPSQGNL